MKRGRKKGSRNKSLSNLPNNLGCWYCTLNNPKNVEAFIKRGDDRQKHEIKECINYWKKTDEEFFKQINGEEILRRLK